MAWGVGFTALVRKQENLSSNLQHRQGDAGTTMTPGNLMLSSGDRQIPRSSMSYVLYLHQLLGSLFPQLQGCMPSSKDMSVNLALYVSHNYLCWFCKTKANPYILWVPTHFGERMYGLYFNRTYIENNFDLAKFSRSSSWTPSSLSLQTWSHGYNQICIPLLRQP